MLKLLKYEFFKKSITTGVLVFGILWLIIFHLSKAALFQVDAPGKAFLAVMLLYGLLLILTLSMLFSIIVLLSWELLEEKRGCLLFTLPQPIYKILFAKLLSTLPLWLLAVAFIISFYSVDPIKLGQMLHSAAILNWTVTFYTFIIAVFFSGVLLREILPTRYHKWYQRKYWWIRLVVGFVFFGIPSMVVFFYFSPFSLAEMCLLISVSTVLFFASVHLLEERVDILE